MASIMPDSGSSAMAHGVWQPHRGPYVLRPLLDGLPLSSEDGLEEARVVCVEYYDGNLYIGTSASELLHFVQLPPDPSAELNEQPAFILASRLQPSFAESNNSRPGIQQILILPKVAKACVLCNWTVTFYSLPELSPVFGATQVKNCNWVGGVDLNIDQQHGAGEDATVSILLSLNRKIQMVSIGEGAKHIKKIDIRGTTMSVRRDSIACVADSGSYALLDVERQLKIPLMAISSLDDSQSAREIGQAQDIPITNIEGGISRSASSAQSRPHPAANEHTNQHSRSASLGGASASLGRPSPSQHIKPPTPSASPRLVDDVRPAPLPAAGRPSPTNSTSTSPRPTAQGLPTTAQQPVFLKPHILSPTPQEFLLVTGTGQSEPGIGLFVNLDGDPTRPTVEFTRYPREVVVDGPSGDQSPPQALYGPEEHSFLLASLSKPFGDSVRHGLEIQSLEHDSGSSQPTKFWLVPQTKSQNEGIPGPLGIRALTGCGTAHFHEIVVRLCQRRFAPFSLGSGHSDLSTLSLKSTDSRTASSLERVSKERELFERDNDTQSEDSLPDGWEASRNAEEEGFASRFAESQSKIAVWAGGQVWWAVRNPFLLQLEAEIDAAVWQEAAGLDPTRLNRRAIYATLNKIRGRDARSELEFVTFSYIRQRAGVLLLGNLLHHGDRPFTAAEIRALEDVLLDSALDARVVLSLIPGLRNEIVESRRGIWIYSGVKAAVEQCLRSDAFRNMSKTFAQLNSHVVQFLQRFLASWRKKKGFGSVPDESEVIRTVDAALIIVLLELDLAHPRAGSSIRIELNELVDKGVDCFDRAASLFESYHRLFLLSRLYQSRKMAGEVLATWRRIIEGERDDGGEFQDGEQRVRDYLTRISNQALVQEYGLWLANRNPQMGAQVFAEDNGRAPKFEASHALGLLRTSAPQAVKFYLEHLVFDKGHTTFVNELIMYYLDVVVGELRQSKTSRDRLQATHEAYRSLTAPKPTFQQFLTDNAQDTELWHSRLRLLQLLGSTDGYDAAVIREQISSLPEQVLVSEIIVLDGREGRHEDAIRLLVHQLRDYDTAVSYCLRGGTSMPGPGSKRRSTLAHETQSRLFRAALGEFLAIEDVSDRVEQTGALLERFGGWFELDDVLAAIPDTWSASIVSGFLVGALRRLVQERHQTTIARSLSSAEYLHMHHGLIVELGKKGPSIEPLP